MRVDLQQRLQRALQAGNLAEALAAAEELLARGEEGDPSGKHASWAGAIHLQLGQPFEAAFHLKHALQVVEPYSRLEAICLGNLSLASLSLGGYDAAIEAATRYLTRYPSYPPEAQALLGVIYHRIAESHDRAGRFDQAVRFFAEARDAYTRLGQEEQAQVALLDLAWVHCEQGDVEAAEVTYSQVLQEKLRPRGEFAALGVQGFIRHIRRDFTGSDEAIKVALQKADQMGESLTYEKGVLLYFAVLNAVGRGAKEEARHLAVLAAVSLRQAADYGYYMKVRNLWASQLGREDDACA